jgi:hypothetical protein
MEGQSDVPGAATASCAGGEIQPTTAMREQTSAVKRDGDREFMWCSVAGLDSRDCCTD